MLLERKYHRVRQPLRWWAELLSFWMWMANASLGWQPSMLKSLLAIKYRTKDTNRTVEGLHYPLGMGESGVLLSSLPQRVGIGSLRVGTFAKSIRLQIHLKIQPKLISYHGSDFYPFCRDYFVFDVPSNPYQKFRQQWFLLWLCTYFEELLQLFSLISRKSQLHTCSHLYFSL